MFLRLCSRRILGRVERANSASKEAGVGFDLEKMSSLKDEKADLAGMNWKTVVGSLVIVQSLRVILERSEIDLELTKV